MLASSAPVSRPNASGPYTFKWPSNSVALYASKHNPFVNFSGTQDALANMVPDTQLATDLAGDALPSFSLIVPDQCHDMHGTGGCNNTNSLIAAGDAYVGDIVSTIMAAKQWQKRPRPGEDPAMPSWMAGIDSASPAKAALLGVTLSAANPKNLALTLAASASIAEADLTTADTAIAVAAFVAIGSATVAGAVLFYLVAPAAAARPLAATKQFMSDNNAVIMMVVLLLLGAKLLGYGLGGISY